jgi:hypothetical protein
MKQRPAPTFERNEGFNEGVLAGLKALAESCKARRDKKAPNA